MSNNLQQTQKQVSRSGGMDLSNGDILSSIKIIALPAMLGQFFNSMYNWIDTFWGGKISADALSAFAASFPIFLLSLALGQLCSGGAMVLISNALGEKREQDSKDYLAQASVLSLVIGVVTVVVIQIVCEPLLAFQGASGQVLTYAVQYTRILLYGFPFLMLTFTLNSGLTSRGNTKFMRNIFIMNVCINMLMDPLLLYGLSFGGVQIIPAMGIGGIALATVIVQVLGAVILLKKCFQDDMLPRSISCFAPRIQCYRSIIVYGLPSFFQLLLVSVGLSLITFFLFQLGGNSASAAYGIGLRIEQMALIPAFGLSIALSALVGQNNGAKKFDRILISYRTVIYLAVLLLISLMLPLTLFGNVFATIFTSNVQVIATTELYLFFALAAFMGYQTLNLSQGVLTGMKKPHIAIFIIVMRQLFLPFITIPLFVYVFDFGIIGLFTAMVLNVWVCAFLMSFFALRAIAKRQAEVL